MGRAWGRAWHGGDPYPSDLGLATADRRPEPVSPERAPRYDPRVGTPRRLTVLSLGLSFLFAVSARPGFSADPGADEPIKQIDRKKVVGPPVLDERASEGIYVWLEDGCFQLAAVTDLPFGSRKRRTKTFTIHVSSTMPITEDAGAFKKTGGKTGAGGNTWIAEVVAGPEPERRQFKTEGEITILEVHAEGKKGPLPIYVGPLAKRAAAGVKIGRY